MKMKIQSEPVQKFVKLFRKKIQWNVSFYMVLKFSRDYTMANEIQAIRLLINAVSLFHHSSQCLSA